MVDEFKPERVRGYRTGANGPPTPRNFDSSGFHELDHFNVALQTYELIERRLSKDPDSTPAQRAAHARLHAIFVQQLSAYGLEPLHDPHDTAGTGFAVNIIGTPMDPDWIRDHLDEASGMPTVKLLVHAQLETLGPAQLDEVRARVRKVRPEVSDSAIQKALDALREEGRAQPWGNPGNYTYQTTSHQTGASSNGTG